MSVWEGPLDPETRAAVLDARDDLDRALTEGYGSPENAPCRMSPEMWFPGKGSPSLATAREICGLCLARVQCRIYGEMAGEDHGVWGGVASPGRQQYRETAKSKLPKRAIRL